jgi:hypothetical protein
VKASPGFRSRVTDGQTPCTARNNTVTIKSDRRKKKRLTNYNVNLIEIKDFPMEWLTIDFLGAFAT